MVPYWDQSDYKYYNCNCITSGSQKARWSLTQITQKSAGKKSVGHERQLIVPERRIETIIQHMIADDKIYKDETGYQKGGTQKR